MKSLYCCIFFMSLILQASLQEHWMTKRSFYRIGSNKCYLTQSSSDLTCVLTTEDGATADLTSLDSNNHLYIGNKCVIDGPGNSGKLRMKNRESETCGKFEKHQTRLVYNGDEYVCPQANSYKLRAGNSECEYKFYIEEPLPTSTTTAPVPPPSPPTTTAPPPSAPSIPAPPTRALTTTTTITTITTAAASQTKTTTILPPTTTKISATPAAPSETRSTTFTTRIATTEAKTSATVESTPRTSTTAPLITPSLSKSVTSLKSHIGNIETSSVTVETPVISSATYNASPQIPNDAPSVLSTLVVFTSHITKYTTLNVTSATSLIQLTSVVISPQKGSYYGNPTKWMEKECPVKCMRSTTTRYRKCENIRWQLETTRTQNITAERCISDERRQVECLDMENCNSTSYYLANNGLSCLAFCKRKDLICNPSIETGNQPEVFNNVILKYSLDPAEATWNSGFGPYCSTNGKCAEYQNVPANVPCDIEPPKDVQRLCYCQKKEDVGFGSWSPWSSCSSMCNGTRSRKRECFDYCYGDYIERESCGTTTCLVHGGFSEWTGWSSCTQSCGGGTKIKYRKCDHPVPGENGKSCVGRLEYVEQCNVHYCPVEATWSGWTLWSGCLKPCNNGTRMRQRFCSQALYGGNNTCEGDRIQYKSCNSQVCPETSAAMIISFEKTFSSEYLNRSSKAFQQLEHLLNIQFKQIFLDQEEEEENENLSYLGVILHSARKGSTVVNLTVNFSSFDSQQFLIIQDSIDVEGSIGKLPISSNGRTQFKIDDRVPSVSPPNITISSQTANTLRISWSEIQFSGGGNNSSNNNAIKGYIVFYREKIMTSSAYKRMATESTSLEIDGLHPGTAYQLRLLAYTEYGNGVSSHIMEYTTRESKPSLPPSSLNTSSHGPFSIFIEWAGIPHRARNGALFGYKIYTFLNTTLINTTSTSFGQLHATVEELSPATVYCFQICTFNRIGDGPCEKTLGKTQTSSPTLSPVNVTVDAVKSHDQLTIHWLQPIEDSIHGDLIAYKISVTNHTGIVLYEATIHPGFNTWTLTNLNANTRYVISVAAVNEHGVGVEARVEGETCTCPEVVTTSYHLHAPYLYRDYRKNNQIKGLYSEVLTEMVAFVCGTCQRSNGIVNSTLEMAHNGRSSIAERNTELRAIQEIDEYTALTFPVVGSKYLDRYLNYPYVSLVDHPGILFIGRDKTINEVVVDIVTKVMVAWPLFVVNLLFMFIAGFIVWIWEGGMHKEADFSKKILEGLVEGWYWAFITIGTHGYGDFTPRYRLSRLFTVAFILIGLVMTSLLVASIVTAVTTVNDGARLKIYGTEIGAISGSFEERIGVLRNGKVNSKKKYKTVDDLKDALLRGEIEGVLLDAYTAGDSKNAFKHPRLRALQMIKYPRTYGMVVSGPLAYASDKARDYVGTNQQRILDILDRISEKVEPKEKEPIKLPYESDSKIFKTTVIILASALAVITVIGSITQRLLIGKKNRVVDSTCVKQKELSTQLDSVVKTFHDNFLKQLDNITLRYAKSSIKLRKMLTSSSRSNRGTIRCINTTNEEKNSDINDENISDGGCQYSEVSYDPVYVFSFTDENTDIQKEQLLLSTNGNKHDMFEINFDTSSIHIGASNSPTSKKEFLKGD